MYINACNRVVIGNNVFYRNSNEAPNTYNNLHAYSMSGSVIDGNVVVGASMAKRGIYLRGTGNILSNNIVYDHCEEGIVLYESTGGLITGNRVYANSQNTTNTKSGILVSHNAIDNYINTNYVHKGTGDKVQKYGIEVSTSAATGNVIKNNYVVDGGDTISIYNIGTNTIITNNTGYVTENSGTATIPNGSTSIVVNHGLATTPTRVQVTPTLLSNANKFWVTDKTATQFTINVDSDPGAGTAVFDWRATVGEGN
jgi:parallel beta-helix repeat protein